VCPCARTGDGRPRRDPRRSVSGPSTCGDVRGGLWTAVCTVATSGRPPSVRLVPERVVPASAPVRSAGYGPPVPGSTADPVRGPACAPGTDRGPPQLPPATDGDRLPRVRPHRRAHPRGVHPCRGAALGGTDGRQAADAGGAAAAARPAATTSSWSALGRCPRPTSTAPHSRPASGGWTTSSAAGAPAPRPTPASGCRAGSGRCPPTSSTTCWCTSWRTCWRPSTTPASGRWWPATPRAERARGFLEGIEAARADGGPTAGDGDLVD
jgi:hypothetical protein